MLHCNDFIVDFMKRYNYPETAVKEFIRLENRLDEEKTFGDEMDELQKKYLSDTAVDLGEFIKEVEKLAQKKNENKYTLDFIFILNCTPWLYNEYRKKNIPEHIFYDTMNDMKCKLIECMDCKSVPGTFVGDWFGGFFEMRRFAFGRFQYEIIKDYDCHGMDGYKTKSGFVLKKGMTVINFHIPSSGISLTDEVRMDSYKKAYEHYKYLFPDGNVVFRCESWLLYPGHKEFLPEKSNILKFMDDFDIFIYKSHKEFTSAWRVFGKYADMPLELWPEDTSLRKAYVDRLKSGGDVPGWGEGVFVFDGEKILKNIK